MATLTTCCHARRSFDLGDFSEPFHRARNSFIFKFLDDRDAVHAVAVPITHVQPAKYMTRFWFLLALFEHDARLQVDFHFKDQSTIVLDCKWNEAASVIVKLWYCMSLAFCELKLGYDIAVPSVCHARLLWVFCRFNRIMLFLEVSQCFSTPTILHQYLWAFHVFSILLLISAFIQTDSELRYIMDSGPSALHVSNECFPVFFVVFCCFIS